MKMYCRSKHFKWLALYVGYVMGAKCAG